MDRKKNKIQHPELTNEADKQRHGEFKQAVDELSANGHMRHYTAEIRERTGENTSNISKYYYGKKPIGDNFWEKFNKAYGPALKRVRGIDTSKRSKKLPPSDTTATGPIVTTPSRRVAEPPPDRKEKKKLIDHERRIAKLEQQVADGQQQTADLQRQVADLQKLLDEYRKDNDKKG